MKSLPANSPNKSPLAVLYDVGATGPARRKAVPTMFAIRTAIFIAPTPPVTGERALVKGLHSAKATSPTSLDSLLPFSGAATRLMLTSMTVASGLSRSVLTISA